MIIRGASDIRGIRSLNTRRGPISESSGFLKLYQLAAEKDNVLRKVAWVKRQRDQAEKRLSDIEYTMGVVEERTKRVPISNTRTNIRSTTFIEY